MAVDALGNLYIADRANHRIRKVDAAGTITTVAGSGERGLGGDGGPATSAQLAIPRGVAVDGLGNLYIADYGNHRVRRVDPEGLITTVAGIAGRGYGGDGGPASGAQLAYPRSVAIDGSGNLYIADTDNRRIRKVDAAGTITTVAGSGEYGFGGDGGPATEARLAYPYGVAVDGSGNLYIADTNNRRIRKVDAAGTITTVAGSGEYGFGGDGRAATEAQLAYPSGVAVDGAGNLYIADSSNDRIRKVDAAGTITTVAGSGERGLGGDRRAATEAQLRFPSGVAVDGSGNLYIADTNNRRIRKVDAAGTITTVAGTGEWGIGGDGGPASGAQLAYPWGVAVDGLGNLYITDHWNHRVRRVDLAGVITTVAGTGERGYGGDGGPAASAQLYSPSGVVVDGTGNLYIADYGNHRVRRVDLAGVITTVAGTGERGYGGDGGPAASAQLYSPSGVVVDGTGNLYIADYGNHRVRRVDLAGVITTVAGTGKRGYGGDGGPAASAQLYSPSGVVVDGTGNLYIADYGNHRVRRVDLAGVITTVAGTGKRGYGGDGGPAASAQLYSPSGVVVDGTGNLYIADYGNHRVRRVDLAGVITTVAGTGERGYGGDGGPAASAQLYSPSGVVVDGTGNLYIADSSNHRVRRIALSGLDGAGTPVTADDHGNDASSAMRLALNSSRDGRIETPGDEDWFRLETSVPRDLSIRTTGGLDTLGTLFDASNRQLASNDDGGDRLNFAIEATVAAGVYYVRVKGYGSTTGSYTIHESGHSASQLAGMASGYRIDTFAGSWERGDGGAATEAQIDHPYGVAVDGAGNLYIADTNNDRIRKVDAAGTITTVAGSGESGFGGDGGAATEAQLAGPRGVAVDGAGNLYIADTNNHRIRKVDAAGIITTIAGSGEQGFGGDGGAATAAQLAGPSGVALDGAGNLYIADTYNQRIRKVDAAGTITTVAGSGERGFGGDGGAATEAQLDWPTSVVLDGAGNLYIADSINQRIRKVDAAGSITTVAGSGEQGFGGDGGAATGAQFNQPYGVAVDRLGNLYIADASNQRIRKVDAAGTITTVAGAGEGGFSGDGGAATGAQFNQPYGVAVDRLGNLYIADASNQRIRKVDAAGTITTVAGAGEGGFSGDGGAATEARLEAPYGVVLDGAGNLYIADTSNQRIRKVDAAGTITTVAGAGEGGFSGDGGAATEARLEAPHGVAVDGAGNIYIADTYNQRIRKVDAAGSITTVAGTGEWCDSRLGCFGGDGGAATEARLGHPYGVAIDGSGNLYIADRGNHRIRKVDAAGSITTVAGTGERCDLFGGCFGGDGGAATEAQLASPSGVAVDGAGNLYIADSGNHRIRKVDAAGIITTIAGSGEDGFGGDGGAATEAQLAFPSGVAVDGAGNLYIAERGNHRIRKVDAAGIITTIAGSGEEGFGGDGGAATAARLAFPSGVAVDGAGNLYIADTDNSRVRRITVLGRGTTTPPVVADDHGNDASSATQLALNSSLDGRIETPGDEDWFRLELSGPREVTIRTTGGLDTAGTLFAASNRQLASNNDGGDRLNFAIEATVAAGVYYVRVKGYGSTTGSYTIHESGHSASQLAGLASDYRIDTFVGSGERGFGGDGGAATEAQLAFPSGVAVDGAGNLYIADTDNDRIRKVDAAGTITTVAGSGEHGFGGDGGAATEAQLDRPTSVAVDGAGNLYIADRSNHRIRKVDAAGTITTVAGSGERGFGGDGGAATEAQLWSPGGVAVDGAGNLYIADTGNDRIRKVDAAGTITTVAGSGRGSGGDGGPATEAQLWSPYGVAVDGAGNLYIAASANDRIRKVDAAGTITTVAGSGEHGFGGDGGAATEAQLGFPGGVAVDGAGNLYIADSYNHRIRKVDAAGTITTVAGGGERGFGRDGGAATEARLRLPRGVAVDGAGNLYIADTGNDRIRKLTPVGGSGATGSPELVVQALSVSDSSLDEGASFTLSATVRNQGAGPSGATTLRYYRSSNTNISTSDTQVGTNAIGSLSASGSSTESVSLTAPSSAGTYYYGACVDPVPRESNTANNCSGGVRVTVRRGDGLAPADGPAFNSRMVGNRIISQILSIDFAAAGRFILSGRFPGSYSYSSTESATGTVTLTFDSGGSGIPGGFSFDLAFTFTSASRGSMTLAGSRFYWILSSISEPGSPPPPLFPDRSGSQLDFFIFDVLGRQESRAYDVQIRRKTTPPSRWQTGCLGADPPTPDDLNFRSIGLFATGVPQGTHQVRYRHRNSSRCGSGTPGEWSEIGEEGVTRWPW